MKRIFRVPFGVILYAMEVRRPEEDLSPVTRWLWTHIVNEAAAVFVISDFTAARAAGWLRDGPLHKLPLGVDPDKFAPGDTRLAKRRLGLPDRKIILTVGRLVERKGHDIVLQALGVLVERYPQLTYLIVGNGPEAERLSQRVTELSLGPHVEFHTDVLQTDLPLYYQACDAFVMPCREIPERNDAEGFGLVFLEAAACAKPVVAGRSGGVPDAVIDRQTGLLVNPNDVGAVVEALTELLDDDNLARRLGSAGRQRVETEMNWDRTAQTILNVMGLEQPSGL